MATRSRRIVAWTGGTSWKRDVKGERGREFPLSPEEKAIARRLYADQVREFTNYWKSPPDADTRHIFRGRADADAYATVRAGDTRTNPRGTSTRTEVRSPTRTSTSTKAYTRGNVTVTGGAGAGNTSVTLRRNPHRAPSELEVYDGSYEHDRDDVLGVLQFLIDNSTGARKAKLQRKYKEIEARTRRAPSARTLAAHARGMINPAPRSKRAFAARGKSRRLKHPTRKPSRALIDVIELRGAVSGKLRARLVTKTTDTATLKAMAKALASRFREAISAHRVKYAPSAAYVRTR